MSATLLLVQVMLTLALVQFSFLWFAIKRLLGFMARHRLAGAYQRVSPELFPTDLFPKVPRLVDLEIPVAHWERLVAAGGPAGPSGLRLQPESPDLAATFQEEVRTAPDTPWATSRTWRALLNADPQSRGGCAPSTRQDRSARRRSCRCRARRPNRARPPRWESPPPLPPSCSARRSFPAMLVAFVVRDALARLAQNLVFVIGGVVLVFCSYTLFPFRQHEQLQVLGWIYVAITFTTILTVLVQIKRNEIVASLTSVAAGARSTWDGAFVLKITVFALLPLFTLFAAQFPDIGGLLLRWIEPVQRALP